MNPQFSRVQVSFPSRNDSEPGSWLSKQFRRHRFVTGGQVTFPLCTKLPNPTVKQLQELRYENIKHWREWTVTDPLFIFRVNVEIYDNLLKEAVFSAIICFAISLCSRPWITLIFPRNAFPAWIWKMLGDVYKACKFKGKFFMGFLLHYINSKPLLKVGHDSSSVNW